MTAGLGGTPPPPPGYAPATLPGVAPGSASGIFRGRQVVVGGGQNGFGIFFYNGTPGPGNPPIFAAVAPGTTQDPYGNPVSAVVNIGLLAGAHAGFDANGIEYLADSAGATRILLDPGDRLIAFYDSAGIGANPALMTLASAAGFDPFTGSAFPAGINLPGLPLQAGTTIVDTNGLLTYASLPPTLGGILASVGVPAQFTDSAGNIILPGNTSYAVIGGGLTIATNDQGGVISIYIGTTGTSWTLISTVNATTDGDVHYSAVGGAHLVADTNWYRLDTTTGLRGVWNDMRPLQNSFVGTIASRYPPQWKWEADGTISVAGFVQFPAPVANYNSVTFATLPAAVRPSQNTGHKWPIVLETNVTPVGTPCCQIDTSGNLQFHNLPATGLQGTIAAIYGRYPISSLIGS